MKTFQSYLRSTWIAFQENELWETESETLFCKIKNGVLNNWKELREVAEIPSGWPRVSLDDAEKLLLRTVLQARQPYQSNC